MGKTAFDAIAKASILVVDSCTDSLLSIATTLIGNGHDVKTALSFDGAIEIAGQITLDLLITESKLALQTGDELIDQIRQLPEHLDLPVMFVTAHQSPDVIRRAHDSGAAFHLKKPIDPMLLRELVDNALWMPHLVKSHTEQKTVKQPHVSFANNPFASPLIPSTVDLYTGFGDSPITF
ncbi:MAG: response regulator RpfG family c-di-GMP phosphodiesterase [Mariniblastus sp.]|jgi:response regulator RpfG family c-di-GMP phosphodiesterase